MKSHFLGTWGYWMVMNLPVTPDSSDRLKQEVLKFFQEKKGKPEDYPAQSPISASGY
ncbi:hypothetical protein TWF694_010409 [Orbilia ellipsospora]|uniref:Uncharacterized protein n=1 Tax=Orbilia ellipsospora TaxID=2528407 RepID=A0AAV9XA52_9PEZI